MGMQGSTTKWALKDARAILEWDDRFVIIDQFPIFKNIPRSYALDSSIRRWMNFIDRFRMRNIFHLKI